jgi:hypothetical protein
LNKTTTINALVSSSYNKPVIFIKATELIQILGIEEQLKPKAREWEVWE